MNVHVMLPSALKKMKISIAILFIIKNTFFLPDSIILVVNKATYRGWGHGHVSRFILCSLASDFY